MGFLSALIKSRTSVALSPTKKKEVAIDNHVEGFIHTGNRSSHNATNKGHGPCFDSPIIDI